MKIVLSGFDERTTKAWAKMSGVKPTGQAGPDVVDFGVIQAGRVDPHARGRDIKANLILNYRGPFAIQVLPDSAVIDGQLEVKEEASIEDRIVDRLAAMFDLIGIKKPKMLKGKKNVKVKKPKTLAGTKKSLKKPAKLKKNAGKKQKALPAAGFADFRGDS